MRKTVLCLLITLFACSLSFSQERPLISVLDFTGSSVSDQETQIIVDFISSYILGSGKYRVIDKQQRETILKEQKFSLSGCTDENCQIEAGKLLQAENIIVGSLGKVGSRYLLNIKFINVETGETIRTGFEKYDSLDDLIDDIERITMVLIDFDVSDIAESNEAETAEAPVFENLILDDDTETADTDGENPEEETAETIASVKQDEITDDNELPEPPEEETSESNISVKQDDYADSSEKTEQTKIQIDFSVAAGIIFDFGVTYFRGLTVLNESDTAYKGVYFSTLPNEYPWVLPEISLGLYGSFRNKNTYAFSLLYGAMYYEELSIKVLNTETNVLEEEPSYSGVFWSSIFLSYEIIFGDYNNGFSFGVGPVLGSTISDFHFYDDCHFYDIRAGVVLSAYLESYFLKMDIRFNVWDGVEFITPFFDYINCSVVFGKVF